MRSSEAIALVGKRISAVEDRLGFVEDALRVLLSTARTDGRLASAIRDEREARAQLDKVLIATRETAIATAEIAARVEDGLRWPQSRLHFGAGDATPGEKTRARAMASARPAKARKGRRHGSRA